jgi:membrane protein YqaA with SNARE-associated domain
MTAASEVWHNAAMTFNSDIFSEALRHTLLPIYSETTFMAMHLFGNQEMGAATVAATLGALLAVLLLWLLGRGFFHVAGRVGFAPGRYERLHDDMHNLLPWALLVVWLPVGFAIAFTSGFFNIRLWKVVPIALLGLGANYAKFLMG